MDIDDEIDTECDFPIGLGCALDFFREKNDVFGIIKSLPDIYKDFSQVEGTYENYYKILSNYQEQPHLLDKHLPEMIDNCLEISRNCTSPDSVPLKNLSFKFLQLIFKVRGPKEVVKRMPHEVSDLVPVLTFLETLSFDDGNTWDSCYVSLMWLSILVMNPFHLRLLDSGEKGDQSTIAQRLMDILERCIKVSNLLRHAGPIFAANFLTRPDMLNMFMESFIDKACSNLTGIKPELNKRFGYISTLNAIFKHGKRQEILKYAPKVLNSLLANNYENCDTMMRMQAIKLIQRIGMVFLPTKIAVWRYQRGSRSLIKNLQAASKTQESIELNSMKMIEEEDYKELNQFSSEIESIIDKLLEGLKDKDTVVRWSAAKGIGRVTNRLPKDFGDEVVESILSNFSPREDNGSWHGGCLALAELSRRGLLLPDRLPSVIPLMKVALTFDEIRGNFSVGSHVRDAGCYVLWAFARAYEPHIIQPYVKDIAIALIITMVFDREVNCRRAAAAAFQENVGRQGNFPHGIDIVTIADYFTVGLRKNAYCKVSVEIAKFSEYTRPLIDHLITMKFCHFDISVRELTSEALNLLTPIDPEYMIKVLTEKLLPLCIDREARVSHGAIISLSYILLKLKEINKLNLSEDALERIRDIAPKVCTIWSEIKTFGNDMMRHAVIFHIKCCAKTKMPYHDDLVIQNSWHNILSDSLSYVDERVRLLTTDTLSLFLSEYYCQRKENDAEKLKEYLNEFYTLIESNSMYTRMGHSTALSKFPIEILSLDFKGVFQALIKCTQKTSKTESWTESRRDAIYALTRLILHSLVMEGENKIGLPLKEVNIEELFNCFLFALEDYTSDRRGDIGSWVREAAINALLRFTLQLHERDPDGKLSLIKEESMKKVMGSILKQCLEKIDKIRIIASNAFIKLIQFNDPPILIIPKRDELLSIFPKDMKSKEINWRATSLTLPRFAKLLSIPEYSYYLISGFIASGGSMVGESLMKDATDAVNSFLNSASEENLLLFGNCLNQIFKDNQKVDRVTVPLLTFASNLLRSGFLSSILVEGNDNFGRELIENVKKELANSSKVNKLYATVDILCELLQGNVQLAKLSLNRLVTYLCHSLPRVRMHCAEKFYESLMTYGDSLQMEENQDQIMNYLSETAWDSEVSEVRPIRNKICDLLDIPHPQPKKPLSIL